jgi:hypothetical protein
MNPFESEPKVVTELYNASETSWDEIWPTISKLEDECFPGKGLGEEHLKDIFTNKDSIVVLLKQGSGIIGFTCGVPDEDDAEAMYIETTEITPSEQGKGHVVHMMSLLEQECRNRGYKFITRDAEVANGYADKITKNYAGRIIESHDHESEYSMGGMQRFFKIRL